MWRPEIGVVIEISSKRRNLGKLHPAPEKTVIFEPNHVSFCITLPFGRVSDDIVGVEVQKHISRGKRDDNLFFVPWSRLLEIRDLCGKVLLRNWHLCPECRILARLESKWMTSKKFICPGCHRIVPTRTIEN